MQLKTIFSSNSPIDCYIVKNRLESEGIDCFVFDDHMVWVDPFYAVAVRGVKLKVPSDQTEKALQIIRLVKSDRLIDDHGEYEMANVFVNEMSRQNEILEIKSLIRNKPSLIDSPKEIKTDLLNQEEVNEIISEEKKLLEFSKTRLNFTWEDFWGTLFDPDHSIFKYLRPRPAEYYLDKELVDRYNNPVGTQSSMICSHCNSENVSYGYAIDYKWDVLYLVLSLIVSPFPLVRKKYHCFNCGSDFNIGKNDPKETNEPELL
ncbi:MAG TPA: DUF2007 domain-containing protein [Bacteroidales bacterium]